MTNKSASFVVRSTIFNKDGTATLIREQKVIPVITSDTVQNCVRRHGFYCARALDRMKHDSDNYHEFSIVVKRIK